MNDRGRIPSGHDFSRESINALRSAHPRTSSLTASFVCVSDKAASRFPAQKRLNCGSGSRNPVRSGNLRTRVENFAKVSRHGFDR
jgi:hypothetical protein